MPRNPRVLLIDLNNLAKYPTLSIGYLVSAMRGAGLEVRVLCPLSYGLPAVARERQERWPDHLQRRVYFSGHPVIRHGHEAIRVTVSSARNRPDQRVLKQVAKALEEGAPDLLLLSAYLNHYPTVRAICGLAAKRGIKVLLGGPMFNLPAVSEQWISLPALVGIVGAEVDVSLPDIIRTVVTGGDLSQFPGSVLPDGRRGPPPAPLQDLSVLPIPDFDDFPWQGYEKRVIPVMAGRGCGWGRCQFCSDVITANGRTFRTRPLAKVLEELRIQSERYQSKDFIFLDIKLNSDLELWRGLSAKIQDAVPGARWIGTVHVQRGENGLTRDELDRAVGSGMVRINFGLETGSQHLNDLMAKGTKVEAMGQFVTDAHAAGLSLRTSMMLGYPGERAADVRATADFLNRFGDRLDRIRMSRFKAIPQTRWDDRHARQPSQAQGLERLRWNHRYARASYSYSPAGEADYRLAKREVLRLVHEINARPLRSGTESFDGLF